MRAHHHAFAALDAQVLVPNRNLQRQVTLLPFGSAGGKGAVHGHRADRQSVAVSGVDGRQHSAYELRRAGHGLLRLIAAGGRAGYLDFVQIRQRMIHSGEVLLHHGFAPLAIGFARWRFDGRDGLIARQCAAERKKAGLHHGVDAAAHPVVFGHLVGVDRKKAEVFFDDLLLHRTRQAGPSTSRGRYGAVQQERRAVLRHRQHIQALQKIELMAGHETGARNQIAGADRPGAEAEMRNGHRARFFRVVNEITLRVIIGIFADNLDGILIGADGAVRAQAVEKARTVVGSSVEKPTGRREAAVGDIVFDTGPRNGCAGSVARARSEMAAAMAGVNSLLASP